MIGWWFILRVVLIVAACVPVAAAQATRPADPDVRPAYVPTPGLSGRLTIVGSNTMEPLLKLWIQQYQAAHPNVRVELRTAGSATAPPALIDGSAQIAPMSRPMTDDERATFTRRHGHEPQAIGVAVDALAVYVHRSNSVRSLSLEQLRRIYASDRSLTWGELGLSGEWADKPVTAYGRNGSSGTHAFFAEHVLGGRPFGQAVREKAGSAALVQAVTDEPTGIGYSGIGFATVEVRAVPLVGADGKVHEPTAANAYSDQYPLSRLLYLYVDAAPDEPAPPNVTDFLKLALSREGQQSVARHGYFPAPAR